MSRSAYSNQLQRATDALLRERHGVSLRELIRDERAQGTSFEVISRRIYALTGEAVNVSFGTVRRWAAALDEVDSKAS